MASGHVNRTNRPNTWLHRPACKREEKPCQLGAVHTWHKADMHRGVASTASVANTDPSPYPPSPAKLQFRKPRGTSPQLLLVRLIPRHSRPS